MIHKIKYLVALTLLAATALPGAWAQCWLSGDKLNVKATPGQELTIGGAGGDGGCIGTVVCYRWTPSNYIVSTDLNQPTVQIKAPTEKGTYSFTVKRIGECVQTCNIQLTVTDTIKIASIEPKGCIAKLTGCPSTSDFDIKTSPEGYENYVSITSCEPIAGTRTQDGDEDHMVVFSLTKDGQELDTKLVPVTYYADLSLSVGVGLKDFSVSVSGSLGNTSASVEFDGEKIAKSFKLLKDIVKKTGEGMNALAKMTPGVSANLQDECFEPEMGGQVEVEVSRECCDNRRGVGVSINLEDVSIDYSCGLDIGIGFAKCRIGGQLGFNLHSGVSTAFNFTCDKETPLYEFTIGTSVGLYGGLFAEALSADLARGDAVLTGTITFNSFRLAIARDATITVRELELCFDISAKASLKLMSFIELSTPDISIIDQQCWAPIRFN